ncbi:hypothetical protein [Salibacterium aidingense]|uniref:hypothetical protein n=1 Tax=Salibacterium aidingense TaxID=384933 RepID=UPI00041C7742|nr:hypothetical protein [Salibacterium aidingense]
MKIAGITILMMGLVMGFSILLDMLMGFDMRTALTNAINPFRVMHIIEIFLSSLFVILFITETIYSFIKKRKSRQQPSGMNKDE